MNERESVRALNGIGEKTEKLFAKLGVVTLYDLLHNYPREYDCFEAPVSCDEAQEGKLCAVLARVLRAPGMRSAGNKQIVTLELVGEREKLSLVWFHMPFLRTTLKKGAVFIFRGKISRVQGKRTMEQPEIFTPGAYEALQEHMQPIYPLTAGLTNKMVTKAVRQVLENRSLQQEYLPEALRERFGLSEINYAIQQVHFPDTREDLLRARQRLIFDEFFFFLLQVSRLKEKSEALPNGFLMQSSKQVQAVLAGLPYQLTGAQLRVWGEIERDLQGSTLMARLVQGDVGSGKTVLAFLAMLTAAENGYQSALMVPTEVLARQHYEALVRLLEENRLPYVPVLLTGSCTAKQKREIYEKIADGRAAMIIGTHALIQEKVSYQRLALVITDEQHRFGVRQRTALSEKGSPPHVLVMSATPIPRTLALILYGDLSISAVDELPAKRLPIKNCVVDTGYRPTAYRFMENQIAKGRQVYVICPMVEQSETLEVENVIDCHKRLKSIFPPSVQIEILHGQMKPAEKNAVMERFAQNKIQILVSTTVVEVGVNVPNATVMLVENAERFGLAQLHQLRGRVGRGEHQSYCIFMHGGNEEHISKRLEILNHSNDGFYIAGEDLKLRGPGDLLGVRQSGELVFRIADVFRDAALLEQAQEAVKLLLQQDPQLSLHPLLLEALTAYADVHTKELGL